MRIFILSHIILLIDWDVQFLICKLSEHFLLCLFIMGNTLDNIILKEVAEIFWHIKDDDGNHLENLNCKEPTCQCRRHKRSRFHPWVGKVLWRRVWQPMENVMDRGAWWDSPGGPVAKTLLSQCRGPGFDPLVRELDPTCHNYELHATAKTEEPVCGN